MPRPERWGRLLPVALWIPFALLLLWPLALNGGPLLFFDSLIYVDQGRAAVEGLASLVSARLSGGAGDGAAPGFEAAASSASFIRSIAWSAFAFIASAAPFGLSGPVFVQALMVSGLVILLLAPAAPAAGLFLPAGLALLAVVTTLPWYASTLMPDLLAAVVILFGMLLVRNRAGEMPTGLLLLLGLVAAFAILSHYGHLPLAVAVAAVVLLLLLRGRRLTAPLALAALAPILLAVGLNMLASRAAFDAVEVAPKRLPILLARSIADGPARWYLEQSCPESGYVLCAHVATLPKMAGGLLWGPDSMLARATPEEVGRRSGRRSRGSSGVRFAPIRFSRAGRSRVTACASWSASVSPMSAGAGPSAVRMGTRWPTSRR